jgi:hypothetical protein
MMKRDPETGMFIGPDECHYESERECYHYGVLKLCGCGSPEEAYNFLRDVLQTCDRRDESAWKDAEGATKALILQSPEIAAHALLHLLTNLDVIEHGGSVGGSWLTDTGTAIVDLPPFTEDM